MSSSSSSGGLGLGGALLVVFITLKLIGKIDWSWWWVLAPAWMPVGIVLVVLVIMVLVMVIMERLSK